MKYTFDDLMALYLGGIGLPWYKRRLLDAWLWWHGKTRLFDIMELACAKKRASRRLRDALNAPSCLSKMVKSEEWTGAGMALPLSLKGTERNVNGNTYDE